MGIFDLFRRRKASGSTATVGTDEHLARYLADFAEKDYLGKAAVARGEARNAEAAGNFNAAWALYQDVKELYRQHAMREGFSAAQTLALDASVSLPLANILRKEGKHHDALVHVIYWAAGSGRPESSREQKLRAYFNRCKFRAVEVAEMYSFVESIQPMPDFVKIRATVAEWRDCDI